MNTAQYCKAIIIQFKINKLKKKMYKQGKKDLREYLLLQYTKLILTDYKDLPQLELATPYSECLEDFTHPCYGPCL